MKKIREYFVERRKNKVAYMSSFENGRALALLKDDCVLVYIDEKYKVVEETSLFCFSSDTEQELLEYGYTVISDFYADKTRKNYLVDRNLQKIEGHEYRYIDICHSSNRVYLLVNNAQERTDVFGLLDEKFNEIFAIKYKQIKHLGEDKFATIEYDADEIEIHNLETKQTKKVKGSEITIICEYKGKKYYRVRYKDNYCYYDEDFINIFTGEEINK